MIKLKNKKIILIIVIFLGIIMITSNTVIASSVSNSEILTDFYDPEPTISSGKFLTKAQNIFGYIRIVGIIAAVIAIAFMGLKYMFGSIEEKASYKKTIFPYLVGCFMIMSILSIMPLFENIIPSKKIIYYGCPFCHSDLGGSPGSTKYCNVCQKTVDIYELYKYK